MRRGRRCSDRGSLFTPVLTMQNLGCCRLRFEAAYSRVDGTNFPAMNDGDDEGDEQRRYLRAGKAILLGLNGDRSRVPARRTSIRR